MGMIPIYDFRHLRLRQVQVLMIYDFALSGVSSAFRDTQTKRDLRYFDTFGQYKFWIEEKL